MATSYSMGYKIKYDIKKKLWVWAITGETLNNSRPCARCGRLPTKKGYDACMGHVKGVKAACCGHGIMEGYKI